ncbi:hypothetical protein QKG26_gp024 [Chelonid alphaherpesvirus 5]|uniref:Uncharacterized protein n=1 Tax=Chelonid alphaherpesvirus 5 TaxID=702736 RepID=V5NWG3_9ALPH|nr:hypothetical protein QKG26_gp007 [Chelonid alphaherpesvirus 5]YP_010795497.1 hypothetical protein QKG26_gp024 [Chelonid alphaherpesvirus 5]AHA93294.1 hypothetical protein [Chelonid alphaherpesvirus 5]AHA93311.1 hypothetical protein [Chelonid alphaherpesvirus 5]
MKKIRNFNSLPLSEMFLLLLLGFYFSFSKWKPERVHFPPPAPTPSLDVIPTPCLRRITVFLCACACVRAGCKRMCRFGTVLGGGGEKKTEFESPVGPGVLISLKFYFFRTKIYLYSFIDIKTRVKQREGDASVIRPSGTERRGPRGGRGGGPVPGPRASGLQWRARGGFRIAAAGRRR